MTIDRRGFLAGGSAFALLGGCGGEGAPATSGGPVATALAPVSAPSPAPSPSPSAGPPSTRLVLWGDSRTEGIGDVAPLVLPTLVAQRLPGLAVIGAGRSGQSAAQIVARQGGVPAQLTLAGNMIPPTGPVTVTAASANVFFYAGDPDAAGVHAGTLGGVAGVYVSDGRGERTFTRTTDGAGVAVPAGTAFLTDLGEASRDAAIFLCVGRNGIEVQPPGEVVALTLAAIAHLAGARRAMIAAVMPDRDARPGTPMRARFDALNAALAAAHGDALLDLAAPPTDAEMAATGFAPDAADRADIADGLYPARMFQDAIHLAGAGQAIWAERIASRMRARGWT